MVYILLSGHPRIQPKSFVKPDIYEHFAKDYMFLGCIKYINEVWLKLIFYSVLELLLSSLL